MTRKHLVKKAALTFALAVVTTFGSTALASAERPVASETVTKAAITTGTKKIDNRLRRLDTLQSRIDQTRKLNSANKDHLTNEVSNTKLALTELKTELQTTKTAKDARHINQKIVTDNRVYLVVVKKVHLAKLTDHLLYKQVNLVSFAELIKQTAAQKNSADTATATIDKIIADTNANILETRDVQIHVLSVTPNDYNADKQVLKRDFDKLKTIRKANIENYTKLITIANKL